MQDSNSIFTQVNNWFKESVMIKLFSIGVLVLILLIPTVWVSSLVEERQSRADEVMSEVAGKWSGDQTLAGPVLVIPFTKSEIVTRWESGVKIMERVESEHKVYFLPEKLSVTANMKPEVLHRGIFDAVVYESKIGFRASFDDPNFAEWNIPDNQVHWEDAILLIGVSDQRGISDEPVIASGSKTFPSDPASNIRFSTASTTGIATRLSLTSRSDLQLDYTVDLSLKGSNLLYVLPAGKSTDVKFEGAWASPSFEGKMLPDSRSVGTDNFSATWKVLAYNRPYAQQWQDDGQLLDGSEFGVKLLIPADQYQKSMRTAKYDILIILLAFTALFLVEISTGTRIHPFQYILVGSALIIYYILLLSLSEHVGYNIAYAIASISTISLLALYSTTFLKTRSLVFLFSGLMSVFYTFIFVIIQAEDFSLLIGSLGLFIIIATVMYFSRNINWYKGTPQGG